MTDEIRSAPLDALLLDPENPRLPESVKRDQRSMLDYISQATSIEELMDAIAQNGFFPGEPLIVVPDATQADKFVVVEGNRRLTAVKLLQDPTNCTNPGTRMREIAAAAQFHHTELPIIVCAARSKVLPYLGFRHITGIKPWDPLAKARYIEQLFDLTNAASLPKIRYGEVASAIGSRRDHIKRNLDALAAYKTIKGADFYNIEELDDSSLKFSVLSTALADERIGAFAGVVRKNAEDDSEDTDPIINPAGLDIKAIEELTRWLFEKDVKGKTKVGESRNLRKLSAVVNNSRALAALRGGSPLNIAYQLTSDVTRDFIDLLYQAEAVLTEAAGMVATVDYEDDAYQVARRISENIKMIGRELKEKNKPDEDEF